MRYPPAIQRQNVEWVHYTLPQKAVTDIFSKLYFVLYFLKGEFIGPNYYITHVWPSDIGEIRSKTENERKHPPLQA